MLEGEAAAPVRMRPAERRQRAAHITHVFTAAAVAIDLRVCNLFRCRAEPLRPFVCAQQYIDDPLLINKRKFDVRVWVLVAGHEPFRVYLHK